jgi:hypothetical protein
MYGSLLRITLYSIGSVFAGRKSNSHQNFWLVRFWDEWYRALLGSGTLLTRKDQKHFGQHLEVQYFRSCLKPVFTFAKKKLDGSLTRYRTYRNLCCGFRKITPVDTQRTKFTIGKICESGRSIDLLVYSQKRENYARVIRGIWWTHAPFPSRTQHTRIVSTVPRTFSNVFTAHGILSLVSG